jgi:hypothetical protein
MDTGPKLFEEIVKRRVVMHEGQRNMPLTFEEVVQAVRGRQKYDRETKKWVVEYRPMRDLWIILLKTISDKVLAYPSKTTKVDQKAIMT